MTQSTDFLAELAKLAAKATPGEGIFADGNAELSNFLMHNVDAILALGRERDALLAKYNELLFAVAQKYPDETRHETALRYINEREARQSEPGQALEGDNQ